jgi:hypothetical protein
MRQTAEVYLRLGELFAAAKEWKRHGEWLAWLRSKGLKPDTVQEWMAFSRRAKEGCKPLFDANKNMSFSGLQRLFKQAKKDARNNQRLEASEKLIRAAPPTVATR